jgi:hypothetical protein
MRRDYFTLAVSNVDWVDDDADPSKPTVSIDFDGPVETLETRLTDASDDPLAASETDAAFRFKDDVDDEDATGVVSVTNRVTGDFVLELNVDADDVLQFIRAARRYGEAAGDDGEYKVDIDLDGEPFISYEKSTFLVYDKDGNLLRNHSLIPSGVEL